MKHIYILAFLLLYLSFSKAGASANDPGKVTQIILYSCENASEVSIVWGINGWKMQAQSLWPEGTYRKGNLLYTPMTLKDGLFSAQLPVIPNTMIDYVFWISKGPRNISSDIWDLNVAPQKDYHLLVLNDNTTLITSQLEVWPKEAFSLLHYAWPLFYTLLAIGLLLLVVKRYWYKDVYLKPDPVKIIIGTAVILLLVLFLTRTSVSFLSWKLYYHSLEHIPQLLWAGFFDYLYVICITLLFLLFLFIFRKYPRVQFPLVCFFIAVAFFSMIAGLLNIRVVEMLGKPFNYRWLYYSDFLNSSNSKTALLANITSSYITSIIVVCITAVVAGIIMINLIEWLLQKVRMRTALITIFICLNFGYVIIAQKSLNDHKWNYDKLANPVTAFLESVNPFADDPELYTMEVPDSLKTFERPLAGAGSEFPSDISNKIKNVIVLVLESTAAEYVKPHDKIYNVTPILEKNLSNSIVFKNVYAHVPATNKSMVSLLGSVYPWLSFTSITQEYPNIKIPTISDLLKTKGYRTAFFNAGDNRFQKANEFLSYRSFDRISDCDSIKCGQQFKEKNEDWDSSDGIDDECAANELISWIKEEPDKPFFSMFWTFQTHYPYYVSGEEKNYGVADPTLNRYLNAVNHSDFVLGKILDELKASGLSESTLVVVIGDHGEAFGRHEQTTHASKIYEENLHIPCVFINPAFNGEIRNNIGGMVDISPTVMDILGLPPAEKWQGRSLFSSIENKRTYFFCPWSDHLFGYREGNKKYIYNATKDITEIYDLEKDPLENNNLALSGDMTLIHQKLAAWVQYQNSFMNEVLAQTPKK
jgi:lipoteichoic acid synthase